MKKITFIIVFFCVSIVQAQIENYSIKSVSANTEFQDFGVSYYGDSTAVFASARKDKAAFNKVWVVNNQPYLELYQGTVLENGDIKNVERFSKVLNTKFHESNAVFTKDLKTVYFSRNNYLDNKFKKDSTGMNLIQLYKANIDENGEWTNVQAMPFNNDNYQTGHPFLNANETKLYFISDMPGGFGLTDIYVVDINADGTYGEPINLGSEINTDKKEMFPSIDENGILYFSSFGHPGNKGGLDVYATKMVDNNSWAPVVNLGHPINSSRDDFAFVYQNGKKSGHFTSNRKGGKGDDDIYSFKELKPLVFKCVQEIAGEVRDLNSGALLPGSLVTLYKGTEKVESVVVGTKAEFSFLVECETDYKVMGTRENYKEDQKVITTNDQTDVVLDLVLNLEQAEFITLRGQLMININPIYFDLDKSDIRDDAAIELQRVVEIMQKYPSLVVQIGSHTDSRAPDNYNWALSNRRAISTMNWIIENGINKGRIFGGGYGETQLVNKCSNNVKCTEAEHQLNRRTEFIIVNPGAINQ